MQTPDINTKISIEPKIYAYRTPNNLDTMGWFKIGYTEKDVDKRIKEQTHTAAVKTEHLWDYNARFNDGSTFNDHAFHEYLVKKGVPRKKGTEWFDFDDDITKSQRMFASFMLKEDYYEIMENRTAINYTLRKEQQDAVEMTKNYFKSRSSSEFLWNAKPRFGKTLSTYDLIKQMKLSNVLILTNRPAVGNSWVDDYEKFIKYDSDLDYEFVSDSPAIEKRDILTREQFTKKVIDTGDADQIAFVSLQDLKGSVFFGGDYQKLQWVKQIDWDLVVVDEAHEAVDTDKTDFALSEINRKYTLHLSGTPFKQIADNKFESNQIFNWSYMDEQEAKANWDETIMETHNPYANLPTLNMYTYQMSNMISDQIQQGANIGEDSNIDYAFDLNEFFSTDEKGKFIYENDIGNWLDTLTKNQKYPFSTKELRNELKHTLWLLDRVDSAKALAELLQDHPVFENYKIVSVAGDGQIATIDGKELEISEDNIDGHNGALDRVRNAIGNYDKTITLTVGQLTTGVTVPEWSGVLMLSNVQSPALYMQTGFRAQNPHMWDERNQDGSIVTFRKQNAYIFDFAPERTLEIVDDFANNLNSSTAEGSGSFEERKENIKRLLNFFPVIGEDEEGEMVELNPSQVLTLPKRIKSREVVRRGFMSNLLFNNISGIFQSPKALEIINNFEKTEQGKLTTEKDKVDQGDIDNLEIDEQGNTSIDNGKINNKRDSIFGDKIYGIEELEEVIKPEEVDLDKEVKIDKKLNNLIFKEIQAGLSEVKEEYGLNNKQIEQKENTIKQQIEKATAQSETELKVFQADLKAKIEEEGLQKDSSDYEKENQKFTEDFYNKLQSTAEEIMEQTTKSLIEDQEFKEAEKKKDSVEGDIRANLRGFSRAIPSFIMAYGNDDLNLMNFDKYVSGVVFKEVTGVTLDDFIFLRDGGKYIDNANEVQQFDGDLFNEFVFNESIKEFLRKKTELSNYFEDLDESIFDYIPPQNTNQIYTPKWVVQKMIQQLEDENPGIYNESSKTFIDLYMKSGLYITEIVKRLYNSEQMKEEIPNDEDRLKHILENQVYGLAPTEIIYRIATNFIFSETIQQIGISQKNFALLDAQPYAEEGTLPEKLDDVFE